MRMRLWRPLRLDRISFSLSMLGPSRMGFRRLAMSWRTSLGSVSSLGLDDWLRNGSCFFRRLSRLRGLLSRPETEGGFITVIDDRSS